MKTKGVKVGAHYTDEVKLNVVSDEGCAILGHIARSLTAFITRHLGCSISVNPLSAKDVLDMLKSKLRVYYQAR